MSRIVLPALISALLLAACAGSQEKVEAQHRRPLRDIFPPSAAEQAASAETQPAEKAAEPQTAEAEARPPATAALKAPAPEPADAPPAPDQAAADVEPRPAASAGTAAAPASAAPPAASGLEEPIPALSSSDQGGLKAPAADRDAIAEEAMGVGGGAALVEEFGGAAQGAGAATAMVEPEPLAPAQPSAAPPQPAATAVQPEARQAGAAVAPQPRAQPPAPEPMPAAREARIETGPAAAPAPAASMEPKPAPAGTQPPRIIVSTRPALLVPVYGAPRLKPVEGTALMHVENSAAIILKGKSGNYYIPVYGGFVQSKSLSGPWRVSKPEPKVLAVAKARLMAAGRQDLFVARPDPRTGRSPSLALGAPRMIVSGEPTALVLVDGRPGYQRVRGTQLSRLVNTSARMFRRDADGMIYLRVGDDWYRAKGLDGPWRLVPAADMPADFDAVKGG